MKNYFCFQPISCLFRFASNYILTPSDPIFPISVPKHSSVSAELPSKTAYQLTSVHFPRIRNLNALAYSGNKWYLCIKMSGKGSISRMSDECLITLETVFSYCYDCQAVMRKFTLAGKSQKSFFLLFPFLASSDH